MLAAFAMISAAIGEPPFGRTPRFECKPLSMNTRTGLLQCQEGFNVKLWGVKLRLNKLLDSQEVEALGSAIRADAIQNGTSHVIQLERAYPIHCYSMDRGAIRVGQCFVLSRGVFGGEDLACLLIRNRLAAAFPIAQRYYSHCPPNSIKLHSTAASKQAAPSLPRGKTARRPSPGRRAFTFQEERRLFTTGLFLDENGGPSISSTLLDSRV
jgi:hypothetical protein